MKLSKETLSVLKNFASINSNLLLKPGGVLSTINAQKNVLADAIVLEEFPKEFGIYDTNEFLGVVGLFSDPEIDFKDKFAKISEGSSSVKFYAADTSVLTVPTKQIKFPESDVDFVLTAAQLATIQKTAAVLRAVDVSIIGADGDLEIVVGDLKNATSNSFNLAVGKTDKKFTANLKIDNLKLMGQDYNVSLSAKKISRFVSVDGKVTVYVAMESTSEF
jgi:hypothetical protein